MSGQVDTTNDIDMHNSSSTDRIVSSDKISEEIVQTVSGSSLL